MGESCGTMEDFAEGTSEKPACMSGPQTLALNTHKAGMEGLDAAKINEIIQKASEGSKFYQHKKKCQERLDAKISDMNRRCMELTQDQIDKATLQMDELAKELKDNRDLSRTIAHVDMDMFYAAVEMRDDPSLRDKPMAVGGVGMLSTSNYAARKFGVRAAMPGFIGKKLCPELVIVKPDFTKYKAASAQVQEIFKEYDPNFSQMSLDEAYLDLTEYLKKNYSGPDSGDLVYDQFGTAAEEVVHEMRRKICEATRLTASAGIAPNTRLAKICSDMNKPNGQFYLPPDVETIQEFVKTLPIRKVSGIGNVMEQHLNALGITTCEDLWHKRGILMLLFSETNYNFFLDLALGQGETILSNWTERDRKSISNETTFKGTSDKNVLFDTLDDLCQELSDDMKKHDIVGKLLTLKIKTIDFQVKTRTSPLADYTNCVTVIQPKAQQILQHEMDVCSHKQPLTLRLMGVRMSTLASKAEIGNMKQTTLFQVVNKLKNKKKMSSPATGNMHEHNGDAEFSNIGGSVQVKDITVSVLGSNANAEHAASLSEKYREKENIPKGAYSCPVCNKEVQASTLTAFNEHIDKCLENDSCNIINGEELGKNHDNGSDRKEHNNDSGNGADNSDIDTNEDGIFTFYDYDSDFESDFDRKEKQENANPCTESFGSDDSLSCPICHQTNFPGVEKLTLHIDECLDKQLLKEESKEQDTKSSQVQQKRKYGSESKGKKKLKMC
ncbi:DNA polymerase kappa-like isoform X2 [Oratosquilla oratoria]